MPFLAFFLQKIKEPAYKKAAGSLFNFLLRKLTEYGAEPRKNGITSHSRGFLYTSLMVGVNFVGTMGSRILEMNTVMPRHIIGGYGVVAVGIAVIGRRKAIALYNNHAGVTLPVLIVLAQSRLVILCVSL